MRFIYLTIINFFIALSSIFAQDQLPNKIKNTEHRLSIEGGANLFSNALNQEFFQSLYSTDKLLLSTKEGVDLQNRNLLFSNVEFSIGMEVKTSMMEYEQSRSIYGLRIYRQQYISGQFNRDFYRLLMFGNAIFQGQDAVLDENRLVDFSYSGVQAIFGKEWFMNNHQHQVVFKPALLFGHSFQSLNIRSGNLYTAPFGEFIQWEADYSYMQVPNSGNLHIKGLGVGFDLGYQYKNEVNRIDFSIELKDIGIIRWYKDGASVSKDTSIWITGSNISFLPDFNFNFDDDFIYTQLANELYYDGLADGNLHDYTPASLRLSIGKAWSGKGFYSQLSYSNILINPQAQLLQAYLSYPVHSKIKIAAEPGILSFHRPFLLISSQIQVGKRFSIDLKYGDLFALVNPSNSYLQQVFVAVNYQW